jgi:hypothetical protein
MGGVLEKSRGGRGQGFTGWRAVLQQRIIAYAAEWALFGPQTGAAPGPHGRLRGLLGSLSMRAFDGYSLADAIA